MGPCLRPIAAAARVRRLVLVGPETLLHPTVADTTTGATTSGIVYRHAGH